MFHCMLSPFQQTTRNVSLDSADQMLRFCIGQ